MGTKELTTKALRKALAKEDRDGYELAALSAIALNLGVIADKLDKLIELLDNERYINLREEE